MFHSREYKELRKELRNKATPAKRLLWQHLRNRQLLGYKFRRQQGIGRYVVDFYCPKLRLAIEVDGNIHSEADVREYDEQRTAFFMSCWIHVVRFTNTNVIENFEEVLEELRWIILFYGGLLNHPQPLLH